MRSFSRGVRRSPSKLKPARPIPARLRLRQTASFVTFAVIFLAPVLIFSGTRPLRAWEGRLVETSSAALSVFAEAGIAFQELRFTDAADRFADAQSRFTEAERALESEPGAIKTLLTLAPFSRGRLRDGERLLRAGRELSEAGESFARTIAVLIDAPATPGATVPLARTFLDRSDEVTTSLALVRSALSELEEVNPRHLPREYRTAFAALQRNFASVRAQLERGLTIVPLLEQFLGADRPREYLFIFENDTELRPGGGFLGSLALLRFSDGEFQILDAPGRGPFAVNDYFPKLLVPPQPMTVVAPNWTLHDANWFADFPTSAQKVTWFYEQARGFAIDGVVAMTPRVIERLLAATGPLPIPEYGVVLTAENFLRTTQDQVEVAYDPQSNQPKQFVIDLIPAVLERIGRVAPDEIVEVLGVLEESFTSKDLMLWLKDDAQATRLGTLGWSAAYPTDETDFLGIVEANLGGGKTSRALERSATLDVKLVDGRLENTLQLSFRHAGTPGDRLTGERYRGYLKVYLPRGSVLLESRGFDAIPAADFFIPPPEAELDPDLLQIERNPVLDELSGTRKTEEFGRAAFGNWIELQPGEERTVTLRYRSGATAEGQESGDLYRLTVAKQPGAVPLPLSVRVWAPSDLRFATVETQTAGGVVTFRELVDEDKRFGLLFRR